MSSDTPLSTTQGKLSILMVRFLALGDVLNTLPIIEALAANPEVAYVDLITSTDFADIAARSPAIRRVVAVDPRSTGTLPSTATLRYDLVVDLHNRAVPLPKCFEAALLHVECRECVGYGESPLLKRYPSRIYPPRRHGHGADGEYVLNYYARSVAPLLTGPLGPGQIQINQQDLLVVAKQFRAPTVCLAPGARYGWKQWPPLSYGALATELVAQGLTPMVVGHSFDKEFVDIVQACCPEAYTYIGDIYSIATHMAVSGIVVGNCSGLSHLASAAGARVICIHSHTLPSMYAPWGRGNINLANDSHGTPCLCANPEPPHPDIACGKDISVEQVLDAVLKLVRQPSSR